MMNSLEFVIDEKKKRKLERNSNVKKE